MHDDRIVAQARELLGEEGFMLFCQAFGGTRVYVPTTISDQSEIVVVLGRALADKLSQALAPDTIRVPLLRRERALWFRAHGLSNAAIARKLGMTEQGINRLFARVKDLPAKGSSGKATGQLSLF